MSSVDPETLQDVVYRGFANKNAAGGRFILVETVSGEPIGPLAHIVRHSPTGMTWGYGGSGPADLARSLLIDALGDDARCRTCKGGRRILFVGDVDDPVAYDPEDPQHVALARETEGADTCWDCDDGYRRLPYQEFKRDFVARWPDEGWSITRSQILAWTEEQITD
jgi:hypothetical protein